MSPADADPVAGSEAAPPRREFRGSRLAGVAVSWMPALLVLVPVALVLWRAVGPVGEGWERVVEYRLGGYLKETAILVLAVTALAIAFGVPSAWLVSVYRFRGRGAFEWLLMLPLAMPGFVAAAAYVDNLERLIPFYIWVRETFGIEAFLKVQEIAPWAFAATVLGSTLFPYVYLSCRAVFSRQAAATLEASRMLGLGGGRTFFRVALPLARPAVAAGGSLVAMEALNDYGVVSYFGLNPLTPGVFRAWMEGEIGVAVRLAVILMAVAMVALAVERAQRGRRRFAADGADHPLARKRLGRIGTLGAWIACGLPLLLGFLIPGVRMARWAAQSLAAGGGSVDDWLAAGHSFGLAAAAAAAIVVGAVLLVGGRRAFAAPSLGVARRIGLLGYAFPSAMVAVGVGSVVSALAGWSPVFAPLALSASVFGLLAAYFVRFLAVAIQPAQAGIERVSGSLHEAARTLGAGPLRALWQVDLPLLWPTLVAGATLAFIDVFKELTLTLVLRPFDFETLATRTFRLVDEGRLPEASLPGLMIVAIGLLGLLPLTRLLKLSAP